MNSEGIECANRMRIACSKALAKWGTGQHDAAMELISELCQHAYGIVQGAKMAQDVEDLRARLLRLGRVRGRSGFRGAGKGRRLMPTPESFTYMCSMPEICADPDIYVEIEAHDAQEAAVLAADYFESAVGHDPVARGKRTLWVLVKSGKDVSLYVVSGAGGHYTAEPGGSEIPPENPRLLFAWGGYPPAE